MPDYPNPYSPEHLKQMDDVIRTATDTHKLCQDCESIGLPFPDEQAANQRTLEIAQRIKRKWFPNSP